MSVVSIEQVKEQLAFTDDVGGLDDALLARKIAAAEAHVERLLGWRIADRFGGEGQPAVPADLVEAVSQLAAWWYENREAAGAGAREVPFGVREIVHEYRDWSF